MDNATHTLCGLALARACGSRLGPWGTGTLVLAANAPDLDIVVQPLWGRPAFLCHHRGVTHSLLGITLGALLFAGLATWLGRALGRPVRGRGLLLAAALGFGSHLLLDALNTYGVRPWLPFDGTWYYGDVAFIVDPWLWLCFGAAAAVGLQPDRASRLRWWFWTGIAVGALLVGSSARQVSLAVPLLWAIGMPLALILRERRLDARRRQLAALAGIGLALLYLLTLGAGSQLATRRARELARPLVGAEAGWSTSPAPAVPWRFRVVLDTPEQLLPVRVDLLRGTASASSTELRPRHLDDPALRRWAGSPEYHAWQVFARQPFTERRGGSLVLDDARYGWPGGRRSFSAFVLPLAGTSR